MARAAHYWQVEPDSTLLAALCPETDFDRQELAEWLNDLLHQIHRQVD